MTFTPPASVRREAQWGLDRYIGRRGDPVVTLAEVLASAPVTLPTVQAMAAYFEAHAAEQTCPGFANRERETKERVQWALRGGNAGRDWAAGLLETLPKKLGGRAAS